MSGKNKTLPRIGNQFVPLATKKIIEVIYENGKSMKENELKKQFMKLNEIHEIENDARLFKFKNEKFEEFKIEFMNLYLEKRLQIIHYDEETSEYRLTEEGESIYKSSDWKKSYFRLLLRKSMKNFTYFKSALDEIKRYGHEEKKEYLESNLKDITNSYQTKIYIGILRDLNIMELKRDKYLINKERLNKYLLGEKIDEDVLEVANNILEIAGEDKGEILYEKVQKNCLNDGIKKEEFSKTINKMKKKNLIQTDISEKKKRIIISGELRRKLR